MRGSLNSATCEKEKVGWEDAFPQSYAWLYNFFLLESVDNFRLFTLDPEDTSYVQE